MYTLKILKNEDFDKLPYKKAKTSLGLANAKTGMAFVRDTGYNDITKATISHELDEMVNKVSPHEEDGIRYKSLASLGAGAGAGALSNILGGMLPGKFGSFIKGASPVISAGAGALANRKGQPFKGALQGFAGGGLGGSVLSGLGGALQGGSSSAPGGVFGKALKGFGSGAYESGRNYLSEIPGMGGFGGAPGPIGKGTKFLSNFLGGSPTAAQTLTKGQIAGSSGAGFDEYGLGESLIPGNIPAAPAIGPPEGPGSLKTGSSLFDKFKGGFSGLGENLGKALPGLATAQLGNLFAPKVQTPDIAGIGRDLQEQLRSGTLGDPEARGLGMTELRRILGEDIGTPPENSFALGDLDNQEAKQQALSNYVNQWKSIRPGADFSNDPEFLRGYNEIQERYDRVRSAQRDEKTFAYTQQQLQSKYNTMVQALNLDQTQMQQYIQLAQLEIDQLMLEYGLSVGEAQQFKQMFGDLAQIQLQNAFPSGNSLADIFSQFTNKETA